MLKNYILVSIRNIGRNKLISAINVLGLSLGLIGFIYISLFIHFENSFDKHHENTQNIYRLALGRLNLNTATYARGGAPMAPTIFGEYPGVESFARFRHFPSLVSYDEKMFYENNFYFTDSTVFSVFTHNFIEGNVETALKNPNSIVLVESAALKIFGRSQNIIGEVLKIDNQLHYMVTGVIDDVEPNSHFTYDYLVSISSIPTHHHEPLRTYQMDSWYAHYFHTYLKLEKNTSPDEFDQLIRDAAKYHSDPEDYQLYGTNMGLFLQPLSEIHLDPLNGEIKPQGNAKTMYILGVVAAIILILGTFNYTNLTTAQSLKRAKEVGLRKTLGAARTQLMQQFISESVLITFISLVIALTIVQLTLPYFNQHFDTALSLLNAASTPVLLFVAVCVLMTGAIGGFYPALVISSYKPTAIFRGTQQSMKGGSFRKMIVLTQFAISMVLITSTIVVNQQVEYMKNTNLGIDTEQILVIPTNGNDAIISKFVLLKKQLESLPEVRHSTITELTPGDAFGGIVARFEGMDKNRNFPTTGVSFDYIKTFDLKLIAGRDFDVNIPTDSIERIVINRTLARQLGWTPEEAVGKHYDYGGDNETPGRVIGVIEDYHFNSLKSAIFPIVLSIRPNFYDKIAIKLESCDIRSAVSRVKEIWQGSFPQWPFEYYFADERFDREYKSDERFAGLILAFSIMALTIGGFGLLGVVLINTRHRMKEICIRKTLGATISNILRTLSKEYVNIILIALIISVPVSSLIANQWLQEFAYRMDSYAMIVLLSPFSVILIAALAIVALTRQAARANPVEVLRND